MPADLAARWDANREARAAVIGGLESTVPTTLAGAAALLTFWVESDPIEGGEMRWHLPAIRNIAAFLERLTAA